MTTRYPGGLIRKTPPTITPPVDGEGGSAPGVWTLEQASYYTKQGIWPKPIINFSGSLYTTGTNFSGELGQNDTVYRSSPTQVGADTNWKFIGVNSNASIAVKNNGTLWAWGNNVYGQLGQNDRVYRSSPTQIGALTTWSKVFRTSNDSYAVKTDGTLWVWGRNESGSLGLNDQTPRSSPIQLGADYWSYVAGIDQTTAAIKTDGTLWTWGSNSSGVLGSNTSAATDRRSSPVQVGSDTNWQYVIGTGSGFISLKTNGTLWGWGKNDNGQIGDNTRVDRSSPTQVGALTTWLSISSSMTYKAGSAIKNDGTLWTWGFNTYGIIGDNTRVDRSSPVQVGAGTDWLQIGSTYLSFVAVKTNKTLWSWGYNNQGQQGQNDRINRSSPTQIGSDTTWIRAYGGNGFLVAVKG